MKTSLTLGVLGGMAPAATLDFLAKVQAFTHAKAAVDHIRVIADINPKIPDLNTPGSGAGPVLAEMAGALRGAGAEVLAIASNAAHAHLPLIERASGLAVIDMIGAAAKAAADTGAMRVGVLGARGSLRLYREYLAAQAMGLVTLDSESQQAFMACLDAIRAGDLGPERSAEMAGFVAELAHAGAETVIAGAGEAALALKTAHARRPVIDPADLLARRCVSVCLGLEPAPTVGG